MLKPTVFLNDPVNSTEKAISRGFRPEVETECVDRIDDDRHRLCSVHRGDGGEERVLQALAAIAISWHVVGEVQKLNPSIVCAMKDAGRVQ